MLIQFSHNGKELKITRRSSKNRKAYKFDSPSCYTGIRFWNNENEHKRKFMKHPGWYLENNGESFNWKPKKDFLYFWGEWEPQSRFELTGNKYSSTPGLPHAVHYPINMPDETGRFNTDPFVFGDHFYYTNCKQNQKGHGKKMLNLPKGSIILFGSERNRADFVVDTIFVAMNSETVAEYKKHPTDYPDILRMATIDLSNGLSDWNRLYKGKMYDFKNHYSEENPYTFCFFPCRTDCGSSGFERPVIDWRNFNLQKPGAGTVLKKIEKRKENDFWHDIINLLLREGFSLGIKLEIPKMIE